MIQPNNTEPNGISNSIIIILKCYPKDFTNEMTQILKIVHYLHWVSVHCVNVY